jgi:hypothetical protein
MAHCSRSLGFGIAGKTPAEHGEVPLDSDYDGTGSTNRPNTGN